jgi:hypothetical protein
VIPRGTDDVAAFDLVTLPISFQARAFVLMDLSPSAM